MELWQLDTIAVDDKQKALYELCESQESTIEDLRYELKEVEDDRDSYKWDADDNYRQFCEMRKERDEALEKLKAVEAIVNELKALV